MFELPKLISVGLALLLLAPFGFLFWVMAAHAPRPESERRAQLEAALRDQSVRLGTTDSDGSFVGGVGITIRESLSFSRSTASWMSFYPRQWIGWLGLASVLTIMLCVVISLFFPGPTQISASVWEDVPQTNQTR